MLCDSDVCVCVFQVRAVGSRREYRQQSGEPAEHPEHSDVHLRHLTPHGGQCAHNSYCVCVCVSMRAHSCGLCVQFFSSPGPTGDFDIESLDTVSSTLNVMLILIISYQYPFTIRTQQHRLMSDKVSNMFACQTVECFTSDTLDFNCSWSVCVCE